jgi:hypothetical protein
MDRFNWDHDACVNCPVSGGVWEDVLRLVARWHMRVDLNAPRMERVCKRWKHFWQVAEGVFDIDVRRNLLPGMTLFRIPGVPRTRMSMKEVKQSRERYRLLQLVGSFQSRAVCPPPPPRARPPPMAGDSEVALALLRAQMYTEQAKRDAGTRTESVANFLASWRV